jgi:hypothetical protein
LKGQQVQFVAAPFPWFALQVRTRGESAVESALNSKSYETFLPTYKECRQYSDRVCKLDSALFPGYIFCRLDPNERLPVLTTPGVYDIIRTGDQLQPVEENEIAAIRQVVLSKCAAKPWPYLKVGDMVRGPIRIARRCSRPLDQRERCGPVGSFRFPAAAFCLRRDRSHLGAARTDITQSINATIPRRRSVNCQKATMGGSLSGTY